MLDQALLQVAGEEAALGTGGGWVSSTRKNLPCWRRMGLVACHLLKEH